MRWLRWSGLTCGAAACLPAAAHSPMPGVGSFYAGMLHPWMVPAHAMAIVATGLWLGQHREGGNKALLWFMAAVAAGLMAGVLMPWQRSELALLAVTAFIAVAVAVGRVLPLSAVAAVVALAGGLLGLDSQADGLVGRALWMALGGTALSLLLGLSWMLMISDFAKRPWMKIGLRVVASWLAAAAILVLALSLHTPMAGGSAPV